MASVEKPRIVLLGKTGAGKSSLTNALLGEDHQKIGVIPTTKKEQPFDWTAGDQQMFLVDTPGIMEANKHQLFLEKLYAQLAEAHVILWVVGFPERSLDADKKVIREILQIEENMPLIVVGTGVDRISRQFNPKTFSLEDSTEEATTLRRWRNYLEQELKAVGARQVVLCSAGESAKDKLGQFNLVGVHKAIEDVLPDAAKLQFIRKSLVLGDNDMKAAAIIGTAVAAAAAAAAIPIPLADAIPITTAQAGMIVALAALHGQTLSYSAAGGLAAAGIAAVAGPMIFQQLIKIIPGVGSAVGATVAGGITLAMGTATNSLLKSGVELTPKSLKEATIAAYKEKKQKNK